MDKSERTLFMKALGGSVREYVEKIDVRLRAWVSDELKALSELFEEKLKTLPTPKDGKDGRDGKDADIEEFRKLWEQKYSHVPTEKDWNDLLVRMIEGLPRAKDGKDGQDGINGKDGQPGIDGKDVNPDDIKDLIVDEVERVVSILPPAKDGDPGKPGKDGDSIHPDTIRLMVVEEIKKEVSAIPKPKDGEPGRDALAMEFLPTIDLSKSYPRGTWATYRGGLIRAIRNTEPAETLEKAGWFVMVEGYPISEGEISEDFRTITRRTISTSGKVTEQIFRNPAMLHRGTWRAGETYVCGDCVAHSFSTWHCIAESTTASPSTPNTKDWLLMAGRGAAGKDFRPEEPKELTPIRLK